MKIIKTDGVLSVEEEQLRYLDGLNAEFVEKTLLTEDALIEQCRDADALMILREPITARVLAELKNLKVIGRFGVGLNSIDVEAASRRRCSGNLRAGRQSDRGQHACHGPDPGLDAQAETV